MRKIRIFGVELKQVAQLLSLADENAEDSFSAGQEPSDARKSNSNHSSGPGSQDQDRRVRGFSLFEASKDSLLEKAGSFIDQYKLISILGEGGMGIVYLAEQQHPFHREVALKIIKPGMDSARIVARFEVEQQALAILDHPHVSCVYDAGITHNGRPYFVMEYVEGVSITEYCDKHRLKIDERLYLFLHICEAVQHAHQKGIIHRDIKPSNILVTIHDNRPIPKVIDFGIARAISEPLTERTFYTVQGEFVGTPEYMSPEQADRENGNIDTRTDVYSLGVLLYELLTGVQPFDHKNLRKKGIDHVRKIICEEEPLSPSSRLRRMPLAQSQESARKRNTDLKTLQYKLNGDLDCIALKAIEKQPERRYAMAEALAEDVRRHLRHEPVAAAPPGVIYKSMKFLRRHRLRIAAASMVILACIGIGSAILISVRANRKDFHAEEIEHRQLLSEATMLFNSRRHQDALTKVDRLLESRHVHRQAKLLHAQLLLVDQGAGSAVPELEQLLSVPDEIAGMAHFLLADIYYNYDPCAPGKTPEYQARWKNHREQAESLPIPPSSRYFLRAQAAYSVREMLDMLDKSLELDKRNYDSLGERAHIYYNQQDYQKMALDAARMIGIRPNYSQGYALCALAQQGLGNLEEALDYHNGAIELAPEDPRLYDARRETFMSLGQLDLVLADAQKCTKLRPEDLTYRNKLFTIYTALGRYQDAESEFKQFMNYPKFQEHHPGNPARNLRDFFHFYSIGFVAESIASGRSWHGPGEPPFTAPYCLMHDIEPYYRKLCSEAKLLIKKGFHPSWSPDGSKLAYSHGLRRASGVGVLNIQTGETELLTTSGRLPEWSPDGRYIAFERNRHIWSIENITNLSVSTWQPEELRPTYTTEVWIENRETHEIERVCEGARPHWGHRPDRLYYLSHKDNTLYSLSLEQGNNKHIEVLSNCGLSAVISPDEKYVAVQNPRELKIVDLSSKEVFRTWIAPPVPLGTLNISWSPDSKELSISSGDIGLWIYDIRTSKALKIMNGRWLESCWSRDRRKLALSLATPLEIWLVDINPGTPTVSSFNPVQTTEEHCLDFMEKINKLILMDPEYVRLQYVRADCALWTCHEKADEYLLEFEKVLPPYDAADCASEARWILNAAPEIQEKLLPLAQLLARKANEKDPKNLDYQELIEKASEMQSSLQNQSNQAPIQILRINK